MNERSKQNLQELVRELIVLGVYPSRKRVMQEMGVTLVTTEFEEARHEEIRKHTKDLTLLRRS